METLAMPESVQPRSLPPQPLVLYDGDVTYGSSFARCLAMSLRCPQPLPRMLSARRKTRKLLKRATGSCSLPVRLSLMDSISLFEFSGGRSARWSLVLPPVPPGDRSRAAGAGAGAGPRFRLPAWASRRSRRDLERAHRCSNSNICSLHGLAGPDRWRKTPFTHPISPFPPCRSKAFTASPCPARKGRISHAVPQAVGCRSHSRLNC
jgi:hypothetical protein